MIFAKICVAIFVSLPPPGLRRPAAGRAPLDLSGICLRIKNPWGLKNVTPLFGPKRDPAFCDAPWARLCNFFLAPFKFWAGAKLGGAGFWHRGSKRVAPKVVTTFSQ